MPIPKTAKSFKDILKKLYKFWLSGSVTFYDINFGYVTYLSYTNTEELIISFNNTSDFIHIPLDYIEDIIIKSQKITIEIEEQYTSCLSVEIDYLKEINLTIFETYKNITNIFLCP